MLRFKRSLERTGAFAATTRFKGHKLAHEIILTLFFHTVIPEVFGGLIKGGAATVSLIADEVGPLGGTDDMVYERGHYKFCKADGSDLGVGK